METATAFLIGFLFAAGIYCMLQRSLFRLVLGTVILSQGANLLIFCSGGLVRGKPPIIGAEEQILAAPYADPLPQALVLTAIVISFGITAFALALLYCTHKKTGTEDIDSLQSTDQ